MPMITVSERLIQPAGHHRIPRSTSTWVPIQDPDNPDQPPNHYEVGYHFQHQFAAHLPMPGGNGQASFLFACSSNGTAGATYTTPFVDAEVTDNAPMNVIAYYAPPGGLGPGGGTGWFVDAFSAAHNDFVDDYFVTVEGDAQATQDANIIGELSTVGRTLRLDAYASITSTGESFEQWVGNAATTSDVDVLAADSNGLAIATYHQTAPVTPPIPNGSRYEQWIDIIAGIINDAPGWYIGPDGKPHPYDPGWGTFVEKALQAVVVATQSQGMASHGVIAQAAVRELGVALKELTASVGQTQRFAAHEAELEKA
jgi:hypothetical protein